MHYYEPQSHLLQSALTSPPTPTAASFPVPPGLHPLPCQQLLSQLEQEDKTPTIDSEARYSRKYLMDGFEFDSSSEDGSSASEAEVTTPSSLPRQYQHYHFVDGGRMGMGAFPYSPSSTKDAIEETTRKLQRSLSMYEDVTPVPTPEQATLFPTFGDFLPHHFGPNTSKGGSMHKAETSFDEQRAKYDLGITSADAVVVDSKGNGLGLGLDMGEQTAVSPSVKLEHIKEPVESSRKFAFRPFDSPLADSFTFYPAFPASPPQPQSQQQQTNRNSSGPSSVHAPAPLRPISNIIRRPSSDASSHATLSAPPLTPPRSRTSSRAPCPPPSLPLPPLPGQYTPPRSLKKLPATLPPPFIPASARPPTPPSSYPLTQGETELVASLHNGRVPEVNQLAPTMGDVASMAGAAPIVNTGNHGPMVVQQGDWECGACNFVNWRRRKICMRCFPFANDIGNVLTIRSHAASQLATPPRSNSRDHLTPSPTHSTHSHDASSHRQHHQQQQQQQTHYPIEYHHQPSQIQQVSRSYTFPPPPYSNSTSSTPPPTRSTSFGPSYFYPPPVPTIRRSQMTHTHSASDSIWNPAPATTVRMQSQRNVVFYPALAV